MAVVRTDGGELVYKAQVPMTDQEAKASAKERNARAERLGIKARYVAADN